MKPFLQHHIEGMYMGKQEGIIKIANGMKKFREAEEDRYIFITFMNGHCVLIKKGGKIRPATQKEIDEYNAWNHSNDTPEEAVGRVAADLVELGCMF